jgi:hypothetical protein
MVDRPVRARNTGAKEEASSFDVPSGGPALKRRIHVARAEAGIPSDRELARRAEVRYQTLMDWYADRTRPTTGPLSRIATELTLPVADLWAAWEGDEASASKPDDRALVDAIEAQTVAITAQASALSELAQAIQDARSEQRGMNEGLVAVAAEVARVIERSNTR